MKGLLYDSGARNIPCARPTGKSPRHKDSSLGIHHEFSHAACLKAGHVCLILVKDTNVNKTRPTEKEDAALPSSFARNTAVHSAGIYFFLRVLGRALGLFSLPLPSNIAICASRSLIRAIMPFTPASSAGFLGFVPLMIA